MGVHEEDILYVVSDTCNEAHRVSIRMMEIALEHTDRPFEAEERWIPCRMHSANLVIEHGVSGGAVTGGGEPPRCYVKAQKLISDSHSTNAGSIDARFKIFVSATRYGTKLMAIQTLLGKEKFWKEESVNLHEDIGRAVADWSTADWNSLRALNDLVGPLMAYLALSQTDAPNGYMNVHDACSLAAHYNDTEVIHRLNSLPEINAVRGRLHKCILHYLVGEGGVRSESGERGLSILDWGAMMFHPLADCFNHATINTTIPPHERQTLMEEVMKTQLLIFDMMLAVFPSVIYEPSPNPWPGRCRCVNESLITLFGLRAGFRTRNRIWIQNQLADCGQVSLRPKTIMPNPTYSARKL